jgi:Zn-dependent protease with chaperone function
MGVRHKPSPTTFIEFLRRNQAMRNMEVKIIPDGLMPGQAAVVNALVPPLKDEIWVTEKATEVWDDYDFEGVLAHEQAHANQYHSEILLALYFLAAAYQFERLFRGRGFKGRYFIPNLNQAVVRSGVSYVMERIADHQAKKAGLGDNLASALEKLEDQETTQVVIFSLLKGNYHPPLKGRIKRLRK